MSSLATVRDSLVIAYSQNIIDDVEFALLYDANMSKPVFPYLKYDIHVDIQIWYLPAKVFSRNFLRVKLNFSCY